MIALISGMGGFIGRHLADTLMRHGIKVAGIPRDLFTDTKGLTDYLLETHPDYIFNLGSYGGQGGQTDRDQMVATNILNTYVLLRYSEQIPYKAFIHFGTSSVYGKTNKAMKETDLVDPTFPYAVTKACGELVTRLFDKPVAVVRPFSVFGEGEREDHLMPSVVHHLKSGKTMEFNPVGCHDWMYVEDFTEGVWLVAQNINKLRHRIVNIGEGRQFTNLEMVEILEKISGKTLTYTVKPPKTRDSAYWVANNTLLKSLGFENVYGLRTGLKRTYDYYD